MIQKNNFPNVQLYSDGWANPNPGKWWYWVILSCNWIKKEFYQWYEITTNNRMELTWVITGLQKLKCKSNVQVFTDSKYTINGIQKWWALKWKNNNWNRTKTQKAINYDLWETLLNLVEKHNVTFNWVKWHNWHIENERCDELATLAMDMQNILIDENFIPTNNNKQNNQISLINEEKNNNNPSKIIWNPNLKVLFCGDPCKKCLTPVIKKKPKHTKNTLKKAYYYEYYLSCPNCKTIYMVQDAKRDIKTLKL